MKGENYTKTLFEWFNVYQDEFLKEFDFYLQFIDEIYQVQFNLRIPDEIFDNLPEMDKKIISIYRILNDSGITTSIGALRLFSTNIFSDAYSLLRILAEILSLMMFGNKSRGNKIELYNAFVKLEKKGEVKNKADWYFLQKTKKILIEDYPDMRDIFDYLNNYGSHISLRKIAFGNITNIDNKSFPSFFKNNFRNQHFLFGLNQLAMVLINIEIQYATHYREYDGLTSELENFISGLTPEFMNIIHPKLLEFKIV